jgi:hypothetical protein
MPSIALYHCYFFNSCASKTFPGVSALHPNTIQCIANSKTHSKKYVAHTKIHRKKNNQKRTAKKSSANINTITI